MKCVKSLSLFLIGVFLINSCTKENLDPSNFTIDEVFEMQINEWKSSANEDLSIKINSVLSDTRCPSDVECIHQGVLTLEAHIAIGDQVFIKELKFFNYGEWTLECGGFIFQTLKVTPDALLDIIIEPEDYVFTIQIKKA